MSEAEPGTPPPNLWTLRSRHNPYAHNVFALVQVDPDQGETSLLGRCRRLNGQLEAGLHPAVRGRAIEPTDLTRGYQLVASAEEFVAERLLAHTVHALNLRELKAEMEAIEAMPIDPPESMLPLPICNLAFLTRLLPEFSEVRSEEPRPLSAEMLGRAAQPDPEDEHVYDL